MSTGQDIRHTQLTKKKPPVDVREHCDKVSWWEELGRRKHIWGYLCQIALRGEGAEIKIV
jgi:hypothetical protein